MKRAPLKLRGKKVGYCEDNRMIVTDKRALAEITEMNQHREVSISARSMGKRTPDGKGFNFKDLKVLSYDIIIPEKPKPVSKEAKDKMWENFDRQRKESIKRLINKADTIFLNNDKIHECSDIMQAAMVDGFCNDRIKVICQYIIEHHTSDLHIKMVKTVIEKFHGKPIN